MVVDENQVGRAAEVQTLREFAADISAGRLQALHGGFRFVLITCDDDEDASGARVRSQNHFAHVGQPDARVAEFPLEDGLDFFAQRLAEPLSMIFLATPFQAITPNKTNENIRSCPSPGRMVGRQSAYCSTGILQ